VGLAVLWLVDLAEGFDSVYHVDWDGVRRVHVCCSWLLNLLAWEAFGLRSLGLVSTLRRMLRRETFQTDPYG
jgi:hypothetical protein